MGAANRKPQPQTLQPSLPDQPGPVLVQPARKRSGMRQAVAESRREVAAQLPGVVRALAAQSLTGSVTHLKLFLELSGLLKGGLAAPERQVRERTLEEILVEQWEQDKAIAAADELSRTEQSQAERNRARAEEVLSGI